MLCVDDKKALFEHTIIQFCTYVVALNYSVISVRGAGFGIRGRGFHNPIFDLGTLRLVAKTKCRCCLLRELPFSQHHILLFDYCCV